MKKILIVLIIAAPNLLKAQTKEQTQDWLIFYLNKYFSSTYNEEQEKLEEQHPLFSKFTYYYFNYNYAFYKSNFIVTTFKLKKDSSGINQLAEQIDSICLLRIMKVEIDTSHIYDTAFGIPSFSIKLIFDIQPTIPTYKKPPVIHINADNWTQVNTGNDIEYELKTENLTAIRDNEVLRFKKAFEHLAKLNGAKVIEDFFRQ